MSKTDNKTALPEVSTEVRSLADKIKAEAKKVSIVNGQVTIGAEFFSENQQEGLNIEDAKKYQKQLDTFVHGVALATGELGNELMGKDKSLDKIELKLSTTGRNSIEQKYLRSKEVTAPGSSESTTVYGYLERPKVLNASTRPTGEFKKIKEIVAAGAKNLSK